MKQYAILLDDRSDEALARASRYLGMSRSEVVRRLALLADAAVFWGVQDILGRDPAPSHEELRSAARAGLREWGILTLSEEPFDAAKMAAAGPGLRLVPAAGG